MSQLNNEEINEDVEVKKAKKKKEKNEKKEKKKMKASKKVIIFLCIFTLVCTGVTASLIFMHNANNTKQEEPKEEPKREKEIYEVPDDGL